VARGAAGGVGGAEKDRAGYIAIRSARCCRESVFPKVPTDPIGAAKYPSLLHQQNAIKSGLPGILDDRRRSGIAKATGALPWSVGNSTSDRE